MLSTLALAALMQTANPTVATPQAIPPLEETVTRIERNDAALFWAFFEGCDPAKVEPLLHHDFRMLHDQAGMPSDSAQAMVDQSREQCASRQPGARNEGYANRRLIVPGSRRVQMLGTWGALEEGHHTFHELRQRPPGAYGPDDLGGPTWVMVGGARYIHTWQWMPQEGRYRLLESLSVDHAPSPSYPPR